MKGPSMTTNTAAKPATTLGPSAWVSQVRGLAPGQIPFLLQVAVEAFENGLTPQQFVDALPTLNPDKIRMANWVAKTDLVLGCWANYSQQPPGGHSGGFNLPDRSGGNPVAISQFVLIDGFLSD
jgi:hypothetical protein